MPGTTVPADRRGVSNVVGIALLLGIVVILGFVLGVMAPEFAAELEADEAEAVGEYRTGEAGAYRDELIWTRDGSAGATTTHVVNYTIASDSDTAGNSLNSVVIEYPSGSVDASGFDSRDEVVMVGIDENRDGTIDKDATSDVECCPPDDGVKISNSGATVTIELSGNYNLQAGDSLIVEYESVQNPNSSGNYSVTVGVNGDVTDSGSLDIS
ncbi:MAG: archaellin/type IV pilin N-terminal domain-containing protein [Haloferacaceae archaeon]